MKFLMKNITTFKFLFAAALMGGSFAALAMETDAKRSLLISPYSEFDLILGTIPSWGCEVHPVLPDGVEINGPHRKNIALLVAASQGDILRIELYLEREANINFQDKLGRTPLMLAALKKHAGAVDLLIKSKANLEIKHPNGGTALMFSTDDLPCLRLLLEAGANINALDNEGNNAFSRTIRRGSFDDPDQIIKLLIDSGSDILPAIKTRDSETANPFDLTPHIGEFLRLNKAQRERVHALLWCLNNSLRIDSKIDSMLCLVLAESLFNAQSRANEQKVRDGINNMKTEPWKQVLLEKLNDQSN